MAQVTKITFSEAEIAALIQPNFFYIKHSITQKVGELLSETERELKKIVLGYPQLSDHTNIESPKLFRGENYKQLPYMVLDYPRKFSTDSVFAYRSMFWWGKEFSFTLHLQGSALEHFKTTIPERINLLKERGFYFCVNKSPWHYYFESDNYLPLDVLINGNRFIDEMQSKEFIKFSRKIPVKDFEKVTEFAMETLLLLLQVLL